MFQSEEVKIDEQILTRFPILYKDLFWFVCIDLWSIWVKILRLDKRIIFTFGKVLLEFFSVRGLYKSPTSGSVPRSPDSKSSTLNPMIFAGMFLWGSGRVHSYGRFRGVPVEELQVLKEGTGRGHESGLGVRGVSGDRDTTEGQRRRLLVMSGPPKSVVSR